MSKRLMERSAATAATGLPWSAVLAWPESPTLASAGDPTIAVSPRAKPAVRTPGARSHATRRSYTEVGRRPPNGDHRPHVVIAQCRRTCRRGGGCRRCPGSGARRGGARGLRAWRALRRVACFRWPLGLGAGRVCAFSHTWGGGRGRYFWWAVWEEGGA